MFIIILYTNFINKQLRIHLFFNFGMLQIFPVIQSLNSFEKFCLCALRISMNVPVAICQLPIHQFCSFGKRSIRRATGLLTSGLLLAKFR